MATEHHGPDALLRRRLTRRTFLYGSLAAGLGTAAMAACQSSGGQGGKVTIQFWNLFSGGDGARMVELVNGFNKSHTDVHVQATTLAWGVPYYTKLSTATVAGRPPDVAIMHLSRMASFAPTGIIAEIDTGELGKHGLSADAFSQRPWEMAHTGGTLRAVPLDTHPMVMYYNKDVIQKAGLLSSDGTVKPIAGAQDLLAAFHAAQAAGAQWGAAVDTEDVNPWRMWYALYSQLGGRVTSPDGKRVLLDDGKGVQAAQFMAQLTIGQKLVQPATDYAAGVALFGGSKAGFFLNGEWEVTTFQQKSMGFDVTLFPQIFNDRATWADSHAFVIPRQRTPDKNRLAAAMQFMAYVLKNSITWAQGGHIPAYRPVVESDEFKKLLPQAHYAAEVDHISYDPRAWYSGAASDLQTKAGAAFQAVFTGQASPDAGYQQFKQALTQLTQQKAP